MRYSIMVDFDGTICDHKFPEIGEPKAGVKEALKRLIEQYDIVVSSCRASAMFRKPVREVAAGRCQLCGEMLPRGQEMMKFHGLDSPCPAKAIPDQHPVDGRDYVKEMETWLKKHEIPFTRIDRGDEGKVVAVAYIDDKGIRFQNNWEEIADTLLVGGLL